MTREKNSRGAIKLVWSASDLEYLREHFPTDASCDMARDLGVSEATVRDKAKELGLKKASAFAVSNFYGRYTYKRR